MMDCTRISQMLSAFLDEELEADERRHVRQHLFSCSHCQDELNELRRLHHMFEHLDSVEPPVDFATEVRLRVEGPVIRVIRHEKRMPWGVWALAAAAALMGLVYFGSVNRERQIAETVPPPAQYTVDMPLPEQRYFATRVSTEQWQVLPASSTSSQSLFETSSATWLFPPQQ